jgi:hypothetical protein
MWEQITVRQYLELYDIESNKNITDLDKQVKMLCVVEQKKEDDYDHMKYKDFLLHLKDVTDKMREIPDCKPVDVLEVNGNKYKFVHQIDEITAGQYIDFSHFSQEPLNLNKTAAVFFLPIKGKTVCKYGEVAHEKVAEDLLDARFIDVNGCLLFFYHVVTESILSLPTYSTEGKAAVKKLMDNFLSIGGGTTILN